MVSLEFITTVENEYASATGKPSLGRAYSLWRSRWDAGARDRETLLRLLFLVWYSLAEPTYMTGLTGEESRELPVFLEALDDLVATDAEACAVLGFMARLEPWIFGDEDTWKARGHELLERARTLRPDGFHAEEFAGRGAYGVYFAHMVSRGVF